MTAARALAAALLGAGLLGCAEEAPRDREQEPPAKAVPVDAGQPDAGTPYDGTCGGRTCPPAGLLNTPGCCTRPGTGRAGHELENVGRGQHLCGTDIGAIAPSLAGICLQLSQPGEVDDECPPLVSIAGGDPRPGCCTDEGYCGTLDEYVPLGCFYATGLKGVRCAPGSQSIPSGKDGGGADADAGS